MSKGDKLTDSKISEGIEGALKGGESGSIGQFAKIVNSFSAGWGSILGTQKGLFGDANVTPVTQKKVPGIFRGKNGGRGA